MKTITTSISKAIANPGNWDGAKDWFPTIEVDQDTAVVTITTFETTGHQPRATVQTEECIVRISDDGQAALITGSVYVKNWKHWESTGTQAFVFAVFVGDSGHIYVHRAPATKAWRELDPAKITKRLRKLGIGADAGVLQQGDFLLKPANGNSLPDEEFKHEFMGAGHHTFEVPVLRAWSPAGTQILLTEPVILHHTAVDGIQHPDVTVPAGKWIIGTTAASLRHSNARD